MAATPPWPMSWLWTSEMITLAGRGPDERPESSMVGSGSTILPRIFMHAIDSMPFPLMSWNSIWSGVAAPSLEFSHSKPSASQIAWLRFLKSEERLIGGSCCWLSLHRSTLSALLSICDIVGCVVLAP